MLCSTGTSLLKLLRVFQVILSGRAGGQAARPVFVFFARDAVPITPNAAPEAAEQTMLQLPFEKENGMEELAFAQQ